MAKNDTTMTDAEWNAKFNGPREELLKKVFGNTPCPVADLSPKTSFQDKNWDRGVDFMVSNKPRINKNMNADTTGIASWNDQMRKSGKIVTVLREDEFENLKAKPEPVK